MSFKTESRPGNPNTYNTLASPAEGKYTELRSKFLAFAYHVETPDEAQEKVMTLRRRYHDARHVCYAYALGPGQATYRTVDDGEPSGTAGRPILGQIKSHSLSDVVVIVVRYFGGKKLGTSGLLRAYKAAAASALDDAPTTEVEES